MTRKDTVQSHVCCIEIFSTQLTCTSLEKACPIHGPSKKIWAFFLNLVIILIILIIITIVIINHHHHQQHHQHHQVQHFAFIVFANQINFQEFVVTKQAALKLSLF